MSNLQLKTEWEDEVIELLTHIEERCWDLGVPFDMTFDVAGDVYFSRWKKEGVIESGWVNE